MITPSEYFEKNILNANSEEIVTCLVDLVDDLLEYEEKLNNGDENSRNNLLASQDYLAYCLARIIFETTQDGDTFRFIDYFSEFLIPQNLRIPLYREIMSRTNCFKMVDEIDDPDMAFNVGHVRTYVFVDFDSMWD